MGRRHKESPTILSHLEDDVLGPFEQPGSWLSRNAYKDIPLPWKIGTSKNTFDGVPFERTDWGFNDVPSASTGVAGVLGSFLHTEKTTPEKLCRDLDAAQYRHSTAESAKGET